VRRSLAVGVASAVFVWTCLTTEGTRLTLIPYQDCDYYKPKR